MILTVQVSHEGSAHCWFAFDEADFIRKVKVTGISDAGVVFSATTPRELQARQRSADPQHATAAESGDAALLAREFGWDTLLYRADFLLAAGLYQSEKVDEFIAHVAAVAQPLRACRVYRDEDQALDALYRDPLYQGREGFHAHMALRDQLIALDVLADDL